MPEDDIPQSFFRYYPQFANGSINLSEFARLSGLSRNSVYKYLKIVEGTYYEKKADRS